MKMGILQHLFLGILILQFHPASPCSVFEASYGFMTDDQEISVGSTLVIQCTLYNDTIENHSIKSDELILKFKSKALDDLVVIDDNTVEYRVSNATADDSGIYDCFVPIVGLSPQLVCSSAIAVGYKPLPVQSFACISEGYRNLTCRWHEQPNPIPTLYRMMDYLYETELMARNCPVPMRSGCQYRLDTKPAYIQEVPVLNFIVLGKNSLGTSKQYFRINHFEIIKPSTPSRVVFNSISKTNLTIHIYAPKGLENGEFSSGLIYSTKFYSISTKLNSTREEFVQSKSNGVLRLENLVPNTQYKFEVRCRVNISGDKFYWSDEMNATEITEPDVPYRAPIIESSSFDVQNIAGNRTITLYWKAVPSEFENGDGFHYVIKYHEHYVPTRMARQASPRMTRQAVGRSSASVVVRNRTTHSFENMDLGTAFMFNVVAVNHIGSSSNETAIVVVDKAEKLLRGPKEITVISYGQGRYDVSWKASDQRLANFTLFWCETLKSRPANCDGPLEWMPIMNKTHHELVLSDYHTNYQFAVATTHNHQTSGMFWAPCTVLYGVPYKIRKIGLIPHTSTSLKAQWSLKCEAEKKIIKEYAIHYCAYQGSCVYENWKQCKVNGLGVNDWPYESITNTSKTDYVLSSLNPFTCYFAYIRVRTDGGWGENSDYAFEKSMSAAPSDPPSHVAALPLMSESKSASIQITFDPPSTPNGIITRYIIYYNKTSSDDTYYKEVRAQDIRAGVTLHNVFYYTNYSVEIAACVDRACSMLSEPVYTFTGISRPGIMNVPRLELAEKYVNVSWDPPLLPNGPVEYYEVKMEINDTKIERLFNISGQQTFFMFQRDCTSLGSNETLFHVRAVNYKNDTPLYGDFSRPAKMVICPSGSNFVMVGIILGSFTLAVAVGVTGYCFFRWYKEQAEAKHTNIFLPPELESSIDNPLSTYDTFKSGLKKDHDAGIPSDTSYDRLFTHMSERDLLEAEENYAIDADRNYSGESNSSNKCHDSISSANTTKTHNSMDSGAEVESPPSPDGFSTDSSSTNTPQMFKPGLDIVNEMNLASKDSGLEKDGRPNHSCTNIGLQSMGWCFEGKIGEGQLNAYHKYAVKGTSNMVSFGDLDQNLSRMDRLSLSNSEPSVADFDVGDGTEPLVNPVMQPYSKYGLARSDSNGLNNQNNLLHSPGYSKFGLTYRPLRPFPVIQSQNPHVYASFAMTDPFFPQKPFVPYSPYRKKEDFSASSSDAQLPRGAYSKFGVQPTPLSSGYVPFRSAVNNSIVDARSSLGSNNAAFSNNHPLSINGECEIARPDSPLYPQSNTDLLQTDPDDVLSASDNNNDILYQVLKHIRNAEEGQTKVDLPTKAEATDYDVRNDSMRMLHSAGGGLIEHMSEDLELSPIMYNDVDREESTDDEPSSAIYRELNGLPLASTFSGEPRLDNPTGTRVMNGYIGLPQISEPSISAHVAPQQNYARVSVESV